MEDSSSIQLQFRSGDDLFNNYSIGIIRQVVDKSEYDIRISKCNSYRSTIQQKKEEMRQLVGIKYLEMLHVSDTMAEMNQEFSSIYGAVQDILTVGYINSIETKMCTSFDSDFVYMEEPDPASDSSSLVTPETLWKLYDQSEMFMLCKALNQFSTQRIVEVDY